MTLDLKTAAATAASIITLGGIGASGYEAYREYELQALNIRILQCQVSELRNAHMKNMKVGWECHKIALEYAGMVR